MLQSPALHKLGTEVRIYKSITREVEVDSQKFKVIISYMGSLRADLGYMRPDFKRKEKKKEERRAEGPWKQ